MWLLALACTKAPPVEPPDDSGDDSGLETPVPTLTMSQDLSEELAIPQTAFPGGALADLNADGFLDLVAVVPFVGGKMWLNDGTGRLVFEGETPEATSVAIADFDGDGLPDVYYGRESADVVLFGSGQALDLDDSGASFTPSVFDLEGDGDWDLAVARYPVEFDPSQVVDGSLTGPGNSLLINDGGAFTEVPLSSDVSFLYKPVDIDSDGDQDLLLCNDFGPFLEPNRLLLNEGGELTSGATLGYDAAMYAMGATVLDVDDDGAPDLWISNIGSPLLLTAGGIDATAAWNADIPPTTDRLTSWGVASPDLDLDGPEDLVAVFGPLEPGGVDLTPLGITETDAAEQRDAVLLRRGDQFVDASTETGFESTTTNRLLLVGDLDRDGDPDLVTGGFGSLQVWTTSNVVHGGLTLKGPPGTRATVDGRSYWIQPATTWGQSANEIVVGLGRTSPVEVELAYPDGTTWSGTAWAGETLP